MNRQLITWTPALLAVASAIALLAALGAEHLAGLEPCPLCIYQRWAYVAALALAGLALVVPRSPRPRAALVGLCGVAFLAGAGLALYHVGVEQGVWAAGALCGVDTALPAGDVTALREQLLARPAVQCDEVPWALFGISIAGFNLLASLALAAVSLYAAAWLLKEP